MNLPQYLQEINCISTKLVNSLDVLTHTALNVNRRPRNQRISTNNDSSFEEPHVHTVYNNMSGSLVNRLKAWFILAKIFLDLDLLFILKLNVENSSTRRFTEL